MRPFWNKGLVLASFRSAFSTATQGGADLFCGAFPWQTDTVHTLSREQWIFEIQMPARLRERSVRCWMSSDQTERSTTDKWPALLSKDELARAERFLVSSARTQFILGRVMMRNVLGELAACDPRDVQFDYSQTGKPFLKADGPVQGWCFNLAHSGERALLAVARCSIGVDLERIEVKRDLPAIAARFFGPNERAALERLPETSRCEAFYRLWTRKEAVLKATGDGITSGLSEPDVSAGMESDATAEGLPVGYRGKMWEVFDLTLWAGYAGALAVERLLPGEAGNPGRVANDR